MRFSSRVSDGVYSRVTPQLDHTTRFATSRLGVSSMILIAINLLTIQLSGRIYVYQFLHKVQVFGGACLRPLTSPLGPQSASLCPLDIALHWSSRLAFTFSIFFMEFPHVGFAGCLYFFGPHQPRWHPVRSVFASVVDCGPNHLLMRTQGALAISR